MARIQRLDSSDESRDGSDGEWVLNTRVVELTKDQQRQLAEWLEALVGALPENEGMS